MYVVLVQKTPKLLARVVIRSPEISPKGGPLREAEHEIVLLKKQLAEVIRVQVRRSSVRGL